LILKGRASDKSVFRFVYLKRLKELNLTGTGVTREGVAKIEKALPDCRIHWGESAVNPEAVNGTEADENE